MSKKELNEIIKEIKEIKNPYPQTIFTELTTKDYKKIHRILQRYGYTLDRVSGNLMRDGFEIARKMCLEVLQKLKERREYECKRSNT